MVSGAYLRRQAEVLIAMSRATHAGGPRAGRFNRNPPFPHVIESANGQTTAGNRRFISEEALLRGTSNAVEEENIRGLCARMRPLGRTRADAGTSRPAH